MVITCPNCKTKINLDDTSYAQIAAQVRTEEFSREVEARLASEKEKQTLLVQNALMEKEKELNEAFNKERDDLKTELEYYKNLKLRQSTKMIGETLEQHCQNEFEKLRAAAFPNAYFEKDNDASSGSKGDFIFREKADGVEFISIMFEMKNEMDETASKKKNEHFFKELDKDRNEKNCEYAVLVSMLEGDNDLYNQGIVDVSHKYPKMYVIRPQFFIPMITLLRNAARNTLEAKVQLEENRKQRIDITHFEANMDAFKRSVGTSYEQASKKFNEAIKEIDSTIKHLEKVREALIMSEKHLATVNKKTDELSIRALTKDAPSVAQMFLELRDEQNNSESAEVIEPDEVI